MDPVIYHDNIMYNIRVHVRLRYNKSCDTRETIRSDRMKKKQ